MNIDNISKVANKTANDSANEIANKNEVAGSFSDVSYWFQTKRGEGEKISHILRHFSKEPIVFNGFFLFLQTIQKLTANKTANKISPRQSFRGAFAP